MKEMDRVSSALDSISAAAERLKFAQDALELAISPDLREADEFGRRWRDIPLDPFRRAPGCIAQQAAGWMLPTTAAQHPEVDRIMDGIALVGFTLAGHWQYLAPLPRPAPDMIASLVADARALVTASAATHAEAMQAARAELALVAISAIGGDESAGSALRFYLHKGYRDIILGVLTDTFRALGADAGTLARAGNPSARDLAFAMLPPDSPVWLELFQSENEHAREHALLACPDASPAWAALRALPHGARLADWASSRRGSPCGESPWAKRQRSGEDMQVHYAYRD